MVAVSHFAANKTKTACMSRGKFFPKLITLLAALGVGISLSGLVFEARALMDAQLSCGGSVQSDVLADLVLEAVPCEACCFDGVLADGAGEILSFDRLHLDARTVAITEQVVFVQESSSFTLGRQPRAETTSARTLRSW